MAFTFALLHMLLLIIHLWNSLEKFSHKCSQIKWLTLKKNNNNQCLVSEFSQFFLPPPLPAQENTMQGLDQAT